MIWCSYFYPCRDRLGHGNKFDLKLFILFSSITSKIGSMAAINCQLFPLQEINGWMMLKEKNKILCLVTGQIRPLVREIFQSDLECSRRVWPHPTVTGERWGMSGTWRANSGNHEDASSRTGDQTPRAIHSPKEPRNVQIRPSTKAKSKGYTIIIIIR